MRVVLKPLPPIPTNPSASRLRLFYDAWNRREWDAISSLLDPAIEWFHAGRHELVRGSDAVVWMLRSQAEAFPHARIEPRRVRDADGSVIAEWTVANTRDEADAALRRSCGGLRARERSIVHGTTLPPSWITMLMEFREDYRAPLRAVC